MFALGTIVNVIAIIAGSLLGLFFGHKLSQKMNKVLIHAIGLFCLGLGLKLFFDSQNSIIVVFSLVVGGVLGVWIDIESKLELFGNKLKKLVKTKSPTFLEGFVTTSLIYCIGPMAILGSLTDGMNAQHDLLFTKAILDGTISIGFAATLGLGVLFSSLSVFVYQGSITVLGYFIGNFFLTCMITELSATGGLLISAIGINLLGLLKNDKRIPVGNLLPAIFFAALFAWLAQYFNVY
jgi:uncharacterized protein